MGFEVGPIRLTPIVVFSEQQFELGSESEWIGVKGHTRCMASVQSHLFSGQPLCILLGNFFNRKIRVVFKRYISV